MKPPRPVRRWRRQLSIVFLLGLGFWLLASWLVVDQLSGRTAPIRPEPIPALAWGKPRDVRLTTVDGEQLGAWFFPGRSDRQAVLLLHGNGGTRADCLDLAEWLTAAEHPVFLLTLRAHGDSTGERNDFGYSARHDVVAAVEWLERNCPGKPAIWGRSLGSAAALFAAGELGDRICAYVLECPYRDLRTAVRNRTRTRLVPPFDWATYAGLSVMAPLVLKDVNRISPLDAAANVPQATPVLILAGGIDRRATPEESIAIGKRIGTNAKVVVFERADHLELHRSDPARYRETGLRFLSSCRPSDH